MESSAHPEGSGGGSGNQQVLFHEYHAAHQVTLGPAFAGAVPGRVAASIPFKTNNFCSREHKKIPDFNEIVKLFRRFYKKKHPSHAEGDPSTSDGLLRMAGARGGLGVPSRPATELLADRPSGRPEGKADCKDDEARLIFREIAEPSVTDSVDTENDRRHSPEARENDQIDPQGRCIFCDPNSVSFPDSVQEKDDAHDDHEPLEQLIRVHGFLQCEGDVEF